jgi:Rrf2 family protein
MNPAAFQVNPNDAHPKLVVFVVPAASNAYPSKVKFSVKSDYAARAVLWLAQHHAEGQARTADEMASSEGIPPNFLAQILIELKSGRIVKSRRGNEGGYLLARPPDKITLADVLRCVEGDVFDAPGFHSRHNPPQLREAWERLRQAVTQTANSITFQQLAEQRAGNGRMYDI